MMTRPILQTLCFVIKSADYGEADRIVTCYTQDYGKIKGIAKGARRSKKRFVNTLEPFFLSKIRFSRKKNDGLAIIEGCDVLAYYPAIREDLEKSLYASYIYELTDYFTIDGKKESQLFHLLKGFTELIEAGKELEKIIRLFELRLLRISGFEPVLERCISCHTDLNYIHAPFFNPSSGGIVCSKCNNSSYTSFPVSAGTLKSLLMGMTLDLDKLNRLAMHKQYLMESRKILEAFIQQVLGREIKSLAILNKIKAIMCKN